MKEPVIEDLTEAYSRLGAVIFHRFAPEFTSMPHYAPALAVVYPFVRRRDGSYLQLEHRAGEVVPYAIARYFKPEPSYTMGLLSAD